MTLSFSEYLVLGGDTRKAQPLSMLDGRNRGSHSWVKWAHEAWSILPFLRQRWNQGLSALPS
jgi:hypothetical protein